MLKAVVLLAPLLMSGSFFPSSAPDPVPQSVTYCTIGPGTFAGTCFWQCENGAFFNVAAGAPAGTEVTGTCGGATATCTVLPGQPECFDGSDSRAACVLEGSPDPPPPPPETCPGQCAASGPDIIWMARCG